MCEMEASGQRSGAVQRMPITLSLDDFHDQRRAPEPFAGDIRPTGRRDWYVGLLQSLQDAIFALPIGFQQASSRISPKDKGQLMKPRLILPCGEKSPVLA